MPRPGPRRKNTVIRMSDEQIAGADERAKAEGFVKGDGMPLRSEWVRLAVDYALEHMPHGWRPEERRDRDG